ncbi:uncharacterized protein ASCRUDRAFT_9733 [Ascoidea rubescens DSM 1968]|uniref:Uncharacterized protein n=1 Tax=Ascoidea rubescens DSM 1968 TaxID=1344418 RepID=A0A1D2VBC2_9ASCO|nr:hypothetical protein ASCRUDRAFT_9733 [Ascoidea rubescens DSM 1968]ODV58968.1 hypothetical protein ASCRUDRAFT_9733 [Ascoidea rubescens DSM 1968]
MAPANSAAYEMNDFTDPLRQQQTASNGSTHSKDPSLKAPDSEKDKNKDNSSKNDNVPFDDDLDLFNLPDTKYTDDDTTRFFQGIDNEQVNFHNNDSDDNRIDAAHPNNTHDNINENNLSRISLNENSNYNPNKPSTSENVDQLTAGETRVLRIIGFISIANIIVSLPFQLFILIKLIILSNTYYDISYEVRNNFLFKPVYLTKYVTEDTVSTTFDIFLPTIILLYAKFYQAILTFHSLSKKNNILFIFLLIFLTLILIFTAVLYSNTATSFENIPFVYNPDDSSETEIRLFGKSFGNTPVVFKAFSYLLIGISALTLLCQFIVFFIFARNVFNRLSSSNVGFSFEKKKLINIFNLHRSGLILSGFMSPAFLLLFIDMFKFTKMSYYIVIFLCLVPVYLCVNDYAASTENFNLFFITWCIHLLYFFTALHECLTIFKNRAVHQYPIKFFTLKVFFFFYFFLLLMNLVSGVKVATNFKKGLKNKSLSQEWKTTKKYLNKKKATYEKLAIASGHQLGEGTSNGFQINPERIHNVNNNINNINHIKSSNESTDSRRKLTLSNSTLQSFQSVLNLKIEYTFIVILFLLTSVIIALQIVYFVKTNNFNDEMNGSVPERFFDAFGENVYTFFEFPTKFIKSNFASVIYGEGFVCILVGFLFWQIRSYKPTDDKSKNQSFSLNLIAIKSLVLAILFLQNVFVLNQYGQLSYCFYVYDYFNQMINNDFFVTIVLFGFSIFGISVLRFICLSYCYFKGYYYYNSFFHDELRVDGNEKVKTIESSNKPITSNGSNSNDGDEDEEDKRINRQIQTQSLLTQRTRKTAELRFVSLFVFNIYFVIGYLINMIIRSFYTDLEQGLTIALTVVYFAYTALIILCLGSLIQFYADRNYNKTSNSDRGSQNKMFNLVPKNAAIAICFVGIILSICFIGYPIWQILRTPNSRLFDLFATAPFQFYMASYYNKERQVYAESLTFEESYKSFLPSSFAHNIVSRTVSFYVTFYSVLTIVVSFLLAVYLSWIFFKNDNKKLMVY